MPSDRAEGLAEEQFQTFLDASSATALMTLLYGDAAVRMSDIINVAYENGYIGFWVAIRLSDGGSDEIAYATKADAIKHQLHEQQCCYVKIPLTAMTPKIAHSLLKVHRAVYNAGFRVTDPDNPRRGLVIPR